MSRKPKQATEETKKPRQRKKKTKQTITRAVTHIRLIEANPGKLEALDQMIAVYLPLCQRYVTLFCEAQTPPDKYADPIFETELSDRLHRVALQQAAGIAKSWRTNRQAAYDAYLEDVADYSQARAKAEDSGIAFDPKRKEPEWREWKRPVLRVPVMQANVNVVVVEKSEDSTFDYWLRISTLDKGHPLRVPVNLAPYHKEALAGRTLNTSTTLHKRNGVWWLTLSCDEDVPLHTAQAASKVGVDVGIAHFITTSTNKEYGSFHGKMARAHKRDRQKRRNKARLRACLEKKGVPAEKLPSTSSATGQRLSRHVKQEINRAVNSMIKDHPDARIIYEDLNVGSMRFKARAMNSYLYASNLAHIPEQIVWATAKRGMAAHTVKAAYSSQECPRCHYVDRANRPTQQTFCCVVCGYQEQADRKAAHTLAERWGDTELAVCRDKKEIKALLLKRHEVWKQQNRLLVVQPAVQLSFWDLSETERT
ncbi:MAG: zinc ribbon domain-containing protein [Ktedonobacteraceae bacterium]